MADDRPRFSWTLLTGNGLLLLCALTGVTGSFLSLYGDPGAGWAVATALDRCAANEVQLLGYAVLFGLTTLAAWSLPRFWGAAVGGLTALWTGSVLWNWDEAVRGAGVTVRNITALFSSRVAWGQVFSYESGLRPAQEAEAAKLFLLLMLAGLALLLGGVVVRSQRWWMAPVLTLPPLLPGLLADLYPDWLPFMALAVCWCVMLLTSLCRWAAPDRRGRLTLAALPAVALTLAIITVLFPREGYARPDWAREAENDLLNLTNRLSGYFSRWDGPFKNTVTYVGSAEEADLIHAGPLSYTGRTVLRVTTDYDGWMYLRGSSLAVYEDGVWKALPGGTYESYKSEHNIRVFPLYLPAMREQDGSPVYTVTVNNVGAVGTCVYAPYFLLPQDVDETGMLPVEDAFFAREQGQWSHTMTFVERDPSDLTGHAGVQYTAPAYGGYDGDKARYAVSAYAGYVYDNYLDVPEDLREILELHTFSASLPSSGHSHISPAAGVQMAEQLASYLDDLCQYDAAAPAAPEGTDPVYYFLAESRRGYCMHYASAVTLMLRTAGVPARYVSGFAADIPSGRQTRIPDRAAHAWVEVWVDGFGWYPVEVTPDEAFDWMKPSGAQDSDAPAADTPEPTPEPSPEPSPEPTATPQPTASLPGDVDGPGNGGAGPDLTALLRVLKGAALVTGAVFAVWFVQFAVKRFRARRMTGPDANRSALVCYGYLCRLERWGGTMDTQALELAQKARFSQHTLTEEELSLLRGLVDRERARLCASSGLPKRLLFRYWWGVPPKQGE